MADEFQVLPPNLRKGVTLWWFKAFYKYRKVLGSNHTGWSAGLTDQTLLQDPDDIRVTIKTKVVRFMSSDVALRSALYSGPKMAVEQQSSR